MKKWLAGALALLMMFPAVSCGVNTEVPDNDDTHATEAATEASTDFFPDIERQDYNGESFRMISLDTNEGEWYYAKEMSNEQGSTHVLNNTIYEMNTLVEDYLNVTLEYERIDAVATGGEVFDKVQPSIMSGDDIYQLCILHPYYSYNSFISQNYALDFYELGELDLEQPYWNKDVIEALEVNGHAYIGLGDICKYTINMIYCNKNLLADAGRAVPYDLVRNGRWTLDEFVSITSELYVDDGDGQRNNKDTYGFAGMWDANGSAFMQSCGIYVVTRNEEDVFELSLYGDRLINMYDKLFTWSKDESTYLWGYGDKYNKGVIVDFLDGRSYFTQDKLGTTYLESDFELGMLPMPKYDVAQAEYAHVNWGNNIVLPCTIRNKEMVGQVLELMGYYSKTMVQQDYYDNVLQLRVSEAPDDRDMVELIYNTIVYDPGIAFCDGYIQLWNLVYLPCFGIRENTESVASYYQKNERGAQRALQQIFKEKKS